LLSVLAVILSAAKDPEALVHRPPVLSNHHPNGRCLFSPNPETVVSTEAAHSLIVSRAAKNPRISLLSLLVFLSIAHTHQELEPSGTMSQKLMTSVTCLGTPLLRRSPMQSSMELKQALFADREASFFRLRGGYPIPLAGATWWAILGTAGFLLPSRGLWILFAFVTSGAIFPLALLFAKLSKVDFMHDKTAAMDLLFPAFASMLLFWPIAISAFWTYPQLVPLVLAIGMSIHWPAIGWMYGHTAIFTTHAVVRAIACFALWNWWPASRFTVLPFTVSAIYLATVCAILITSSPEKQKTKREDVTAG
jgi:hypothetical protein